jgi:hypothetical protein
VPIVGLTQRELLPGSAHWVIQVIHLLLGIGLLAWPRTWPPGPRRGWPGSPSAGAVPERVDVAVVGGGVIGLSVARELRLAGVRPGARPGAGGVGRPGVVLAGQRRRQGPVHRPGPTSSSRPSPSPSWSASTRPPACSASTRRATCAVRHRGWRDGLAAAFELQRSLGVDVRWLAPAEALELVPFLRPTGCWPRPSTPATASSTRTGWSPPCAPRPAAWPRRSTPGPR